MITHSKNLHVDLVEIYIMTMLHVNNLFIRL